MREIRRHYDPIVLADPDLTKDAGPLLHYIEDPIARAQQTKEHVGKARDEITKTVTEHTLSQARDQARKEIAEQVSDKLKSALDDSKAKQPPGRRTRAPLRARVPWPHPPGEPCPS